MNAVVAFSAKADDRPDFRCMIADNEGKPSA